MLKYVTLVDARSILMLYPSCQEGWILKNN